MGLRAGHVALTAAAVERHAALWAITAGGPIAVRLLTNVNTVVTRVVHLLQRNEPDKRPEFSACMSPVSSAEQATTRQGCRWIAHAACGSARAGPFVRGGRPGGVPSPKGARPASPGRVALAQPVAYDYEIGRGS
jgi:hypothetical protein